MTNRKSAIAVAFGVVLLIFTPANGQELTQITVNGQDNAIEEGSAIVVYLPDGTTSVEVTVEGSAYCAPGKPFAGLLSAHHPLDRSLKYSFLPEGETIEISDFREESPKISFFFADEDSQDNSGDYFIEIIPSVGSPITNITVSSVNNCIPTERAASAAIPRGSQSMWAVGDAWWVSNPGLTEGHYVNVVVMFDEINPPNRRTYLPVEINGSTVEGLLASGGTVFAFFADFGGAGDNGGEVIVSIESHPSLFTVKPDGSGDFPTIQSAINSAAEGDTIQLTDGLFSGDGNRDLDFLGKSIVVRSQNNDPEECIIDCEGSEDESHRGFYFHSGELNSSTVQGVSIINGNVIGVHPNYHGGGMFIENGSSPSILNCNLINNSANIGGGLFCGDYSMPRIVDCKFHDNWAEKGGAIELWHYADALVEFCEFSNNEASLAGGAMTLKSSSPTISSCTLYGNGALNGGHLWLEGSSSPVIQNTILANSIIGVSLLCVESTFGTPAPILACSNIYGNESGDWIGEISDQLGVDGNISLDPMFADPGSGILHLLECSPCAPFTLPNDECDQIGAWPVTSELGSCCDMETLECSMASRGCCEEGGGIWYEGVTCDDNPCPDNAVCCVETDCLYFENADQCQLVNGRWLPYFASCSPNPCVAAACCTNGDCTLVVFEDCEAIGGEWRLSEQTCDPNPCHQPIVVCCLETGECLLLTQAACLDTAGQWMPEWSTCDPNPCPQPQALVCCYPTGDCQIQYEYTCEAAGGVWHSEWETCDPNLCPLVDAVCCVQGSCFILTYPDCNTVSGQWLVESQTCDSNPCLIQDSDDAVAPTITALLLPRPNPFNSETVVRYSLATGGPLQLEVFDASGRLVRQLFSGKAATGLGSIRWDGNDALNNPVRPGVYFCRMTSGTYTESKRVLLIR